MISRGSAGVVLEKIKELRGSAGVVLEKIKELNLSEYMSFCYLTHRYDKIHSNCFAYVFRKNI
jgi:hypothetical protein